MPRMGSGGWLSPLIAAAVPSCSLPETSQAEVKSSFYRELIRKADNRF